MRETITVNIRAKYRPIRAVVLLLSQILLIGIGIAAGSTAMQWAGFVMFFVILIGVADRVAKTSPTEGISIAEARKRLDELEAQSK